MGVIKISFHGSFNIQTREEHDPSGLEEDLSTLVWDAVSKYGEPSGWDNTLTIRATEENDK